MPGTIKQDDHKCFHIAVKALGNHLQVVLHRSVEIDSILARRSNNQLFHVAIWCVQQPAAFRSRENSNRVGGSRSAQIRSFQWINGDIHFRKCRALGMFRSDLLADIQHRSLIPFTFADDNRATHWHRIHRAAHRLGRDLVRLRTVPHAHRFCRFDRRLFHDASEFEREFELHCLAKTVRRGNRVDLGFWHGEPSNKDADAYAGGSSLQTKLPIISELWTTWVPAALGRCKRAHALGLQRTKNHQLMREVWSVS